MLATIYSISASPIYPLSLSLLLSVLTSLFLASHPPSHLPVSTPLATNPAHKDLWSPSDYSYIGLDFPASLPIPIPKVEMTFGPTTRYQIAPPFVPGSNNSIANSNPMSIEGDSFQTTMWYTTDTLSGGFIRLGPPRRAFALSMFHQLHCLTAFQRALAGKFLTEESVLYLLSLGKSEEEAEKEGLVEDKTADYGHVHHCVNYLRQAFLCASDDTLEEGDFMDDFLLKDENPEDDSVFAEGKVFNRVCRDWSTLYEFADKNHVEFHEYRSQHGYGEWD